MTKKKKNLESKCHLCRGKLVIFKDYNSFQRVTSDCKPMRPGGIFAQCISCKTLQTVPNAEWENECTEIYANYSPYFQASGNEQTVFDPNHDKPVSRSNRLILSLQERLEIKKTGTLLDFGCGNGAFLKAFAELNSEWKLYGYDLDETHQQEVLSIPNVEEFYYSNLDQISQRFDLISMVHVLEHIPNPIKILQSLRRLLRPNGMILIQVPDWTENPFILLVGDHCSHFDLNSLRYVIHESGLGHRILENQIVKKRNHCTVFHSNKFCIKYQTLLI